MKRVQPVINTIVNAAVRIGARILRGMLCPYPAVRVILQDAVHLVADVSNLPVGYSPDIATNAIHAFFSRVSVQVALVNEFDCRR